MSCLKILSLNVGMSSSLAGVADLVKFENIDIVFLQETRLISEQAEQLLRGFKAVSNIDEEDITKPGITLAWRQELPVENVSNLVSCRLQTAFMGLIS